jgi:hypothetical protein
MTELGNSWSTFIYLAKLYARILELARETK